MRILIAEEALQEGDGHWPAYISCIAKGLRAHADHVDVITHCGASDELISRVGGTPWFSRNCWNDSSSQGFWGGLKHNVLFYRELKKWINRSDSYQWVCSLTMRMQHLIAFTYLTLIPSRRPTRYLLLFVQGFSTFLESTGKTTFSLTPSNVVAKLCFLIMRKAIRSGRVVIAAETQSMCAELEEFTGSPVTLFPHPIPAQDFPKITRSITSAPKFIDIVAPGLARYEKGSDLLQGAIYTILGDSHLRDLKFHIQWRKAFENRHGSIIELSPELASHPRVDNVARSLVGSDYYQFLNQADFVVLPYRKSSYHNRLSRVAIEAASMGIPFVYSKGTWMESLDSMTGAGISIERETQHDLVEAIRLAVLNLAELKRRAYESKEAVADYFSAARFRDSLPE